VRSERREKTKNDRKKKKKIIEKKNGFFFPVNGDFDSAVAASHAHSRHCISARRSRTRAAKRQSTKNQKKAVFPFFFFRFFFPSSKFLFGPTASPASTQSPTRRKNKRRRRREKKELTVSSGVRTKTPAMSSFESPDSIASPSALRVADHFPKVLPPCAPVAALFFHCFSSHARQLNGVDANAARRGLRECRAQMDDYDQCMAAALDEQRRRGF
jgi:hypothetical protein